MINSKTYEIILISYDVYSAGKYCAEVTMQIQVLVVEGARPKSVLSGGVEYRAILIGCKCGITLNFLIICYYKKISYIGYSFTFYFTLAIEGFIIYLLLEK